jgi:hypothetical protein
VGYLRASLPADEFARLVQERTPQLVLLSAQTDVTAEALGDVLRTLRRLPPPRPELAYGGWIFNARPELRARMPGVFLGADAARRSRPSSSCWAAASARPALLRRGNVHKRCNNDAYHVQQR